jgi:hypothetical protein
VSNRNKDCTPAFPETPTGSEVGGVCGGMMLRDFYAAHAMQAIIITRNWREGDSNPTGAEIAFRIADQMMEAREK